MPARGRLPRRGPGGRARGPGGLRPHAAPDGPPVHGGGVPGPAPPGAVPPGAGGLAGIPRGPLRRPSRLPFLSERKSPDQLPGTRPSSVMRSRAHSPPSTRTVVDAVLHLRAPCPPRRAPGGAGRPRRSRYVCEMWRPIFPSPGGPPSGIINPCATAAARRAGAGTLRTGYRGWSDRISAPSGTDALNHTNSKYERMCTEV